MEIKKIKDMVGKAANLSPKKKEQALRLVRALLKDNSALIKVDANEALQVIESGKDINRIFEWLGVWIETVENSYPERIDKFIESMDLKPYESPFGYNDEADEIVMRLIAGGNEKRYANKASRLANYRQFCKGHPLRVALLRKAIMD